MSTLTQPRLKAKYNNQVKSDLQASLSIDNVMQIPKIDKIVINMGVGRAAQQASLLEAAVSDLSLISGQKPVVTIATKSIAGFKLREGQAIGCKVTLRGDRMWEFLDRLIAVAIPRIRDFRGLMHIHGMAEELHVRSLRPNRVPGINPDKVDNPRGMDITIVTTATTDAEGRALLEAFGFPFKRGADADNAPRRKKNRHPQFRGGKKK